MYFMEDQNDKIIVDSLKLARSYMFLKREVILLRTEREDRERRVIDLENKFYKLQRSYDNLKEVQNDISYQYTNIKDRLDYLEFKNEK